MTDDKKKFSSEPSSFATKSASSIPISSEADLEYSGSIDRKFIGRFEVIRQLGKGGFGFVYLAKDPSLNRQVAIKVPRWDKPLSQSAIDRFQVEGRMLAQVNHASIVSVYDVSMTDDGVPFVVMEFVDGLTLSDVLKQNELTIEESLTFLLAIAEALQQAHKSGLIHRDFKPGNVIIKIDGQISLVDFGLALHDDLTPVELENKSVAGTPSFMAPEQLRGENHLIGGQTDIWAFGVTMYRMLVGVFPFKGKYKELSRSIRYKNPRPLRQLNETIPKPLELICLRCMQKLMEDRYQSMMDVIEELKSFIEESKAPSVEDQIDLSASPSIRSLKEITNDSSRVTDSASKTKRSASTSESTGHGSTDLERISLVPKGLRSFDQNDREFFLKLLPGPTDRHGFPESIRFWIARLDQTHQIEPIKVGIIYGPSGCGKSSFVRAGLIPSLTDCVIPIYVDCTQENLTQQIVHQIRQDVHSVPENISLTDLLKDVRRGKYLREGDKLLLVLDQFEQWLDGNIEYAEAELTDALRQCDTKSVQALLLLRDEFWLSASQFMKCLDQRIEESRNATALPLFDQRHARRVLEAFGRAYNRLPPFEEKLSSQEKKFVKEAVSSLSNRGKVICVHLAVFAETAKNQPWNFAGLKSVGGWEGIGREYVSGIFENPETPGYIKKNATDCWEILRQLLPTLETELKGKTVSRTELQRLTGLDDQPTKFDELMDFLEIDSKLISRFENTDAIHQHKDDVSLDVATYQLYGLTHDFLVKPIRAWGMAKQQESRQGRADVLLNNLSNQWSATGSDRYLPSGWDFGRMLFFSSSNNRKRCADFWGRAKRRAGQRLGIFGVAAALILASVFWFQQTWATNQSEKLTQSFLNCESDELTAFASSITPKLSKVETMLRKNFQSDVAKRRTRAAAALLMLNGDQPDVRRKLLNSLGQIPTDELLWFQKVLAQESEKTLAILNEIVDRSGDSGVTPRRAIFGATLGEPSWVNTIAELKADPSGRINTIEEVSEAFQLLPIILSELKKRRNQIDESTHSCLCCGLAEIDKSRFSANDQTICRQYMIEQYQGSPCGGVHSAALYGMTRWKMRIPEVFELANSNWCELRIHDLSDEQVVVHRLPFVKIRKGSFSTADHSVLNAKVGQDGIVESDFWICVFEIPEPLFKTFFAETYGEPYSLDSSIDHRSIDESELKAIGPYNTKAASNVSADHADDFVDWLNSSDSIQLNWINRPDSDDKLEFSLPSADEFELASRAKTETDYFFGDASKIGQYIGKGGQMFGLVSGQFPPNGFGLHDTSANLAEWVGATAEGMQGFGVYKGVSDSDSIDEMKAHNALFRTRKFLGMGVFGLRVVLRKSENGEIPTKANN